MRRQFLFGRLRLGFREPKSLALRNSLQLPVRGGTSFLHVVCHEPESPRPERVFRSSALVVLRTGQGSCLESRKALAPDPSRATAGTA